MNRINLFVVVSLLLVLATLSCSFDKRIENNLAEDMLGSHVTISDLHNSRQLIFGEEKLYFLKNFSQDPFHKKYYAVGVDCKGVIRCIAYSSHLGISTLDSTHIILFKGPTPNEIVKMKRKPSGCEMDFFYLEPSVTMMTTVKNKILDSIRFTPEKRAVIRFSTSKKEKYYNSLDELKQEDLVTMEEVYPINDLRFESDGLSIQSINGHKSLSDRFFYRNPVQKDSCMRRLIDYGRIGRNRCSFGLD